MTMSREPRSLEAYVIWFLKEWADEIPTSLHKNEVFFGPPSQGLDAAYSTPDELVGGSKLGTPAYSEPARRLLEEDHPHREESAIYEGSLTVEKHLATPMRSALRRCGRFMEAFLVEIARNGGDWRTSARKRGCHSETIARVYANEAFRKLYREYQPVRPAPVRKPSWVDKSDSQRSAEDAA